MDALGSLEMLMAVCIPNYTLSTQKVAGRVFNVMKTSNSS
jgi:hypothetical protein